MTVMSIYAPVSRMGNGATVIFDFPYQFFAPADLKVTLFDMVGNTAVVPAPVLNGVAAFDYTVSGTIDTLGTGEYLNGAVTFRSPPPANVQVTIERAIAPFQPVALADDSLFPAKTIEAEFDRLQMQIQQNEAGLARAITVPASDPAGIDLELPPAAVRAGKLFGFDDAGGVETALISDEVQAAVAALLAGVAPAPTVAGWAPTLGAAKALYAAPVVVANGQVMEVACRLTANDGYGGAFAYKAGDAVTTFTLDAFGFVDAAGRRWFRIRGSQEADLLWFHLGGSDYSAGLQTAVTELGNTTGGCVKLPPGVLSLGTGIVLPGAVGIRGDAKYSSVLRYTGTGTAVAGVAPNNNKVDLSELTIDVTQTGAICLDHTFLGYDSAFRRLRFRTMSGSGQYGSYCNITAVGQENYFTVWDHCTWENLAHADYRRGIAGQQANRHRLIAPLFVDCGDCIDWDYVFGSQIIGLTSSEHTGTVFKFGGHCDRIIISAGSAESNVGGNAWSIAPTANRVDCFGYANHAGLYGTGVGIGTRGWHLAEGAFGLSTAANPVPVALFDNQPSLTNIKGISHNATAAMNMSGYDTFTSAQTRVVTLPVAEADSGYGVFVQLISDVDERLRVVSQTASNFTVKSTAAASTAGFYWFIVR